MNYKNRLTVIVCLLIIFMFLTSGYIYCQELNRDITMFVETIYSDYSQHNFSCVYEKLYPGIKKVLQLEEYVGFQKENFNKYNLKITDYKVGKEIEAINIPEKFSDYVNNKKCGNVKRVPVTYHMSFNNNAKMVERDISKDVYIYVDKDRILSLLWDPKIIE